VNALSDGTPTSLREIIKKRVLRIIDLFERKYELYLALKQTHHKEIETLARRLICGFGEDFWRIIARKKAFWKIGRPLRRAVYLLLCLYQRVH
jgi:hypothetical protein